MKKRRKATAKIKPPANNSVIVSTLPSVKPFHETFPFELKHMDGEDQKTCWFECEEHMQSYITRYKLSEKQYTKSKTKERT